MVEFVEGKILPWEKGDILPSNPYKTFKCRCKSCKKIGLYGDDCICKYTVIPFGNGCFRLFKVKKLFIFCSGCTMPMIIKRNPDRKDPIFYDFKPSNDPLNDVEKLIDYRNLDYSWNYYYENNHTFSGLNESFKNFVNNYRR